MNIEHIKALFLKHREKRLSDRYITHHHIKPLIKSRHKEWRADVIGASVLGNPIHAIKIGTGNKKVLMWSQMHGNESTTTKALFDLLNTLSSTETQIAHILESCTLYIIPILNPDGALVYTRLNANQVDLNRDAKNLSQPESVILRSVFNNFKPHFCYNLHGQRTIFGAGNTGRSATVSFLSPAQDKSCKLTANRKMAMEVIAVMNTKLQKLIPNQVGVYDDAFNLNCVGDMFQSENVPTILFEAGHYKRDYSRDKTREFIYIALLESLDYIAKNEVNGSSYEGYLGIPENEKCFFDVIIRNVKTTEQTTQDIAFMYQEKLINNKIEFIPTVEKIDDLTNYFAHKELDANYMSVTDEHGNGLKVFNANDFVVINNNKIALF